MISSQHPISARWFLIVFLALACPAFAATWKEQVLYSFQGPPNDGFVPAGGVVFDKAGNLYGATTGGGPGSCFPISEECGLVFQLSPPTKKGDPWTESILYQFKGKSYRTTAYGGTGDCVLLGTSAGCGTVYELSPPAKRGDPWTESLLYSFKSGDDGYFPWGTLTSDSKGNLYGATQFGGGKGNSCNEFYGGNCGTVFELSPPMQKGGKWTEKVLYSFPGVANGKQSGDGANPNGGLVLDSKGAIYGTTYFGGNNQKGTCEGGVGGTGCGTVFELHPRSKNGGAWTEKLLHLFNGQDGSNPPAGVVFDRNNNNLYGTTFTGRGGGCGCGSVYELNRPSGKARIWTATVLHLFRDETDGALPMAGPTFDAHGDLYGTTSRGSGGSRYGNVYRLSPPRRKERGWTLDVVYGFGAPPPDAAQPTAMVVFDRGGSLYSTTLYGGTGQNCGTGNCGTVFEVSP
jgi:hypothetical protein